LIPPATLVSRGNTEDVEEKCPDLIAREVHKGSKKNELILSMERLNREALVRHEDKPRRIIVEFLSSSGETLPAYLDFRAIFWYTFSGSKKVLPSEGCSTPLKHINLDSGSKKPGRDYTKGKRSLQVGSKP
jgi:hypothetical protein